MTVLELTQLRLKPGVSADSPSLLRALSEARANLGTHSRFYGCIEDTQLIYILGSWSTVAAHHEFLASPAATRILADQESLLDFVWCVHFDLPSQGISALPFQAPIIAIARLFIKPGADESEFIGKVNKQRPRVVSGSQPHPVIDGWRCDSPVDEREYLMFSGWASADAHDKFRDEARQDAAYASIRDHYLGMEVKHAYNLEA